MPILVEIWPSCSGEEDFLISSMYFRYFVIISPWKRTAPFNWTNLNPLHPRMHCAKFGWNWPSGSGKEDFFFYFVNVFSLFCNYLSLEKDRSLHLNKLKSPCEKMFCAKFSWNWPSGSGEEDFLISSMFFRYFVIISPWKRAWPFIWTNLNPLHPEIHCAKFGWNRPSGSGEEDF